MKNINNSVFCAKLFARKDATYRLRFVVEKTIKFVLESNLGRDTVCVSSATLQA